jgi:hypothetical protein
VYVLPLTPYVPATDTTDPPTGPKFSPPTYTVWPPAVSSVTFPDTLVTLGAVYDIVDDDNTLVCSPTVTAHCRPLPTPATDWHVTSTCATLTTHPADVYVLPSALTYCAVTTLKPATGPRFIPDSRTDSDPAVDSDTSPGYPVTVGAAYDVVPDDIALC